MKLLLLVLLATGASAFMSMNFQDSGVLETGRYSYKGAQLRSFKVDEGVEVLEPYIALQASEKARVLKTPVGKGYYFSVPLVVDSNANVSRSAGKLHPMRVTSMSVSLRKSLIGQCGKECSDLTVTSVRKQDNKQSVMFRCATRGTCQRIFNALHFSTTSSDFIRAALKFTFYGVSNGRSLRLTKARVPVVKTSERPYSDALWLEGDKLLLYTIKAGVGESAFDSFANTHRFSIPSDGSLPDVYRSEMVDYLPKVLASRSGGWEMVAEMRVGDNRVAQAVFDVTTNADKVDKFNWFSKERLMSTYPWWASRSAFNFFGVVGDAGSQRRFFINKHYGGCQNDEGFWAVSDKRDGCPWSNSGWRGRPPVLVYNKFPGKYQDRGAAYADRFLVYLRYASISRSSAVLPKSFVFESNKLLLFTIKAGIGRSALTTFRSKQNFPIPTDRSLPTVYRSDLLDSLADTVIRSGKKFMVAEMRVGNKPVAQVFFDMSIRRHSLNIDSWFSADRVASSSPYFVGTSGFNFFSLSGDTHWKRDFFISYRYSGCNTDLNFWMVSDARDPCYYSHKFWTGKAPVLQYTVRRGSKTLDTAAKADTFLVYLV